MPVLICRNIIFYAEGDETALFGWLRSIKAIHRIEGVGNCLLLHVPRRVSDKALREFIAIFRRYHIDRRQLAQFETSANRKWARDALRYAVKQRDRRVSKTSK
jgi:hypothetical protein